jgi:hypothetical protein
MFENKKAPGILLVLVANKSSPGLRVLRDKSPLALDPMGTIAHEIERHMAHAPTCPWANRTKRT